jgi:hypothetical protein
VTRTKVPVLEPSMHGATFSTPITRVVAHELKETSQISSYSKNEWSVHLPSSLIQRQNQSNFFPKKDGYLVSAAVQQIQSQVHWK